MVEETSNLNKEESELSGKTACLCFNGGAGTLTPVSSKLNLSDISFAEAPCDDAYMCERIYVNFTKQDWLWLGKQMGWLK